MIVNICYISLNRVEHGWFYISTQQTWNVGLLSRRRRRWASSKPTSNVSCLLGMTRWHYHMLGGGGPGVVVSTAAFHARVRGSVPGLGGLKETKLFLPHPRVKVSIVGSLRDREVACSASDRQGSNFESCVWRTVSSQSSHHPQEVLLAQFSLYVHKGGLKPDSFHFLPYAWYCIGSHYMSVRKIYDGTSFAIDFQLDLSKLISWLLASC